MSASPGSWTARRRPVRAVGATVGHGSNGPRFARFAAAMEAEPPPQAQRLPETAAAQAAVTPGAPGAVTPDGPPTLVRPGIRPAAGPTVVPRAAPEVAVAQPASPQPGPMPAEPRHAEPLDAGWSEPESFDPEPLDAESLDPDRVADDRPALDDGPVAGPLGVDGPAHGMAATMTPRRPVIDGRLRGAIPWLGIGSWLLFCGALFVSLLGWPGQTALDRVIGIWSGHESLAHRIPEATAPRTGPTTGVDLPPAQDGAALPGTAGSLERVAPADVAPSAGPRIVREPGGPPVPQFKPRIDDVAAKFSSAFFEIGNRLQRQGDFDAALHMRRQGTKLDPWKVAGARDS